MILTQYKDTNDIENTQIYFHEIYENTQIYIEKSFKNTQIWMFEFICYLFCNTKISEISDMTKWGCVISLWRTLFAYHLTENPILLHT